MGRETGDDKASGEIMPFYPVDEVGYEVALAKKIF
jgi:hypothetical protein